MHDYVSYTRNHPTKKNVKIHKITLEHTFEVEYPLYCKIIDCPCEKDTIYRRVTADFYITSVCERRYFSNERIDYFITTQQGHWNQYNNSPGTNEYQLQCLGVSEESKLSKTEFEKILNKAQAWINKANQGVLDEKGICF